MPEYKIIRVQCYDWKERNAEVYTRKMGALVAEHIAFGWVPIGGVAVEMQEGTTDALLQSMWRNQQNAKAAQK